MLRINISELPAYVELARKSGNNILIVGDPGVGKSQVINGMANDKVKVTSFTGSSTYEETINGIPFRDTTGMDSKAQRYTEPEWLRQMWEFIDKVKDGYNIMAIDEFNTAEPQVMKTFLSVLTEHKVPTQSRPLPEGTVIIAAMNPCNQNNGEELIRPLASRFMTLEVKSSVDSYRDYIKAKIDGTQDDKVSSIQTEDKPRELTTGQVDAILDQIVKSDWGAFNDGDYHEINPRSMTNFLRALKWVKNPKRECPNLAMAFFGKSYDWADTVEEKEEKRKERIKNKTDFPTLEEIKKMDTPALKAYYEQLQKPNLQGGDKLLTCRLQCRTELQSRGEA